jgi:hypothetical protein
VGLRRRRVGPVEVVAVEVEEVDSPRLGPLREPAQERHAVADVKMGRRADDGAEPIAREAPEVDRVEAPAEVADIGVEQQGRVDTPGRGAGLDDAGRTTGEEAQGEAEARRSALVVVADERPEVDVDELVGVVQVERRQPGDLGSEVPGGTAVGQTAAERAARG